MTDQQDQREATDGVKPQVENASSVTLAVDLFAAWRRVIGAVARAFARMATIMRSAARTWIAQWRLVLQYHASAAEAWSRDATTRETAAALGVRGFVFGMTLAGITMAATRDLWLPGVITVVSEVLWAGMRFIIIALLMPRGAIGRSRLYVAYLAGLLPYAIGATWFLRLLALGLSALLTYRGLLGAGVAKDDAKVTLGWSFGGQAGIIAGGWLLRALLAAVVGA